MFDIRDHHDAPGSFHVVCWFEKLLPIHTWVISLVFHYEEKLPNTWLMEKIHEHAAYTTWNSEENATYNWLNIETIQPRMVLSLPWLYLAEHSIQDLSTFPVQQKTWSPLPFLEYPWPGRCSDVHLVALKNNLDILPSPWNQSLKGWCFYTAGGIFRHDLIYIHRFGSWKGQLLWSWSTRQLRIKPWHNISFGALDLLLSGKLT